MLQQMLFPNLIPLLLTLLILLISSSILNILNILILLFFNLKPILLLWLYTLFSKNDSKQFNLIYFAYISDSSTNFIRKSFASINLFYMIP